MRPLLGPLRRTPLMGHPRGHVSISHRRLMGYHGITIPITTILRAQKGLRTPNTVPGSLPTSGFGQFWTQNGTCCDQRYTDRRASHHRDHHHHHHHHGSIHPHITMIPHASYVCISSLPRKGRASHMVSWDRWCGMGIIPVMGMSGDGLRGFARVSERVRRGSRNRRDREVAETAPRTIPKGDH